MPREIPAGLAAAIQQFRAGNIDGADLAILAEILADFEKEGDLATLRSNLHEELGIQAINVAAPVFGPARQVPAELKRAHYRFVSRDNTAIALAQNAALQPINIPKHEGLSAKLVINWVADGPLLIGQAESNTDADGAGVVVPMSWGDGTSEDFVIPGSSLRGAIRSVAQIIGAGRLARAHLNDSHVYGLRDFTHQSYSNQGKYPVTNAAQVRAGWLRVERNQQDNQSGEGWTAWIEPAQAWHLLSGDECNIGDTAESFTTRDLTVKYKRSGLKPAATIETDIRASAYALIPTPADWPAHVPVHSILSPINVGTIQGHKVFSGKATTNEGKRWEYVFEGSPGTNSSNEVQLSDEIWMRFVRMNCKVSRGKLVAQQSWAVFQPMFQNRPTMRIPVFYVGDLQRQDLDNFAFGLTRLFKVPHKHTLADVFSNSNIADPQSDSELDMVDALFGYVYERPDMDPQAPKEVSRKSRVSFSHASLNYGVSAKRTRQITTTMMEPRSSFAPFYLAGPVKDYSAPNTPKIAGFKRYPAQTNVATGARLATESILGRLTDLAGGGETPTTMQLLQPTDDNSPLAFQSTVRLHNVTLEELGLVLASLTLGEDSRRHMIGRAKGFGSGQMKASLVSFVAEWNTGDHDFGAEIRVETAIEAFETYRATSLGATRLVDFIQTTLTDFYTLCDPAIGAAAQQNGRLTPLPLNKFRQVRERTKPDSRPNLGPPASVDRLMPGRQL
jgi:CRISPR-associated protein (TIGR03986 family)